MTNRYHVPDLPPEGGIVSLPEHETQHAVRVMRIQPNQTITLFDGKGNEAMAVVTEVTKRSCGCEAGPAIAVDRESSRTLHLAVALPKPDRSRGLIERLTELGVCSVTPLVAQRCQRAPSGALLEKLRRVVVEASKQCGRNRLMEIHPPQTATTFFRECKTEKADGWIADPNGKSIARRANSLPDELIAAIGPEGGWTTAELESATDAEFTRVQLGKRVYRIETAAVVIASLLAD